MITIIPKDGMEKLEGIYHKKAVNIHMSEKKNSFNSKNNFCINSN